MAAPPCPKCGAATTFAGYEPWCPSCGWNREEAGKRLRSATRKVPFYYALAVALFGAFFRVWQDQRPFTLFIVFGLPFVPVLLLYASLRWSRAKYEAAVREAPAGTANRPSKSTQAAAPDFRLLLEMPRPRPVRLSRRGRSNLAIAMAGVAAFDLIFLIHVWRSYRAAGSLAALPGAEWMWLALAAGAALVPYAAWKNAQRQRALLETGDAALAKVVRQMRNRSTFMIQYEFRDAQGEKVTGLAADVTRSLYEGMSVPVFFDAGNSKRRVAQCESFCEVILPGRE